MVNLVPLRDPVFFSQNAVLVAQQLLGKYLVRIIDGKKINCKIVETEAYDGPTDDANHGFNNKRSLRNETLFWQGGYAHIFMIYGMYFCFNIVTDQTDYPSAVLLRAGEIVVDETTPNFVSKPNLANGPGKLSRYLKINKTDDGLNLIKSSTLYLEQEAIPSVFDITTTSRVNIDYATNFKLKPYRFYITNHKAVSKK
ncbi:DNA-3-methyladenine glycosylase [Spiroplasma sp. SV19]|uniref:DNA-3-methyladenine glycosylase n=1 Tax=Spiroplasma sp. SV19 TaxID=2570468 RepID=UPI0024B7502C|nr:DNA-3-methyladenine glycosylase [Spiroplasma sp. SV19]WHQ36940.1 DNA-3-methyladenine glycosylase [Spiroplasma sp. SV19]